MINPYDIQALANFVKHYNDTVAIIEQRKKDIECVEGLSLQDISIRIGDATKGFLSLSKKETLDILNIRLKAAEKTLSLLTLEGLFRNVTRSNE